MDLISQIQSEMTLQNCEVKAIDNHRQHWDKHSISQSHVE